MNKSLAEWEKIRSALINKLIDVPEELNQAIEKAHYYTMLEIDVDENVLLRKTEPVVVESREKIKSNKIQCLRCLDIIESKYTHDFKHCMCGLVAVDGGKDYLRRVGDTEGYKEMSEYENV